jgi:hypothetical protein
MRRVAWMGLLVFTGCYPVEQEAKTRGCVQQCWNRTLETPLARSARDSLSFAYAVCREMCGSPFPPQPPAAQTQAPPAPR